MVKYTLLGGFASLALGWGLFDWFSPSKPEYNELLLTPQTEQAGRYMAASLELKDDGEDWFRKWFGDKGEFYITIQSSRFPGNLKLIFPVNQGDFAGSQSRYLAVPFEVEANDEITFELLDDDHMTEEDKVDLHTALKTANFAILVGTSFFHPDVINAGFLVTELSSAGEKYIIKELENHPFQHVAQGKFIVATDLPRTPALANPISLLDSSDYARMQVKIYFPPQARSYQDVRHKPLD